MNRFLVFVFFTLMTFTIPVYGQDVPSELKGLNFYRYVSDNFIVLSIDDRQGLTMYNNVEKIRLWTYKRWGLKDVAFKSKCKIICIPSEELFQKFFHKDDIEPKMVDGGWAIWVCLDDPNWVDSIVPQKIAKVCFGEWSDQYNIKLPIWAREGMSFLNSSPEFIAKNIVVDKGDAIANKLFEVDDKFLNEMSNEQRKTYQRQCGILVLMLKREFVSGRTKFNKFIEFSSKSGEEKALSVYDISGYEQLDKIYKTYVTNLCWDLKNGATPKSYFILFELKNKF